MIVEYRNVTVLEKIWAQGGTSPIQLPAGTVGHLFLDYFENRLICASLGVPDSKFGRKIVYIEERQLDKLFDPSGRLERRDASC